MKIAVISGSRADAGPLKTVHEALVKAGHDSRYWNLALNLRMSDDSRLTIAKTTADAIKMVADALTNEELIVLLGDRYEILGAATAAFLLGKPIAHLSGGDVTEGSQDDSMRHAITKLSHLHFATNRESALRLVQMGEEPWRVHTVGCPGVDEISQNRVSSKEFFRTSLGFPNKPYKLIAVVYHPNTLAGTTDMEATHLKVAIMEFADRNFHIVIIGPNADAGGWTIKHQYNSLVGQNVRFFETMSRESYLDLLKYADVLVGNSSSGFYEAPSFGTPVVNIGDRQQGRIQSANIVTVRPHSEEIIKAINAALEMPRKPGNPYGTGDAAKKIAEIIGRTDFTHPQMLRKKFYDISQGMGGNPQESKLGEIPLRAANQMDIQELQPSGCGTTGGTSPGFGMWTGSSKPIPNT